MQQAWGAFHKHRKVLLNHHVPLDLRLKFFDACISPCAIFAIAILPLSQSQIQSICIVQRKMLRRVVGWRRIDGEPWRDTMIRMNQRLTRAMDLHFIASWEDSIWRARWRFACHIATSHHDAWIRRAGYLSNSLIIDPVLPRMLTRSRGRPRTRWDDMLTTFTSDFLYSTNHWIDGIVPYVHDTNIEDAFVDFCCPSVD